MTADTSSGTTRVTIHSGADLKNFVPYTGATGNVSLGTYDVSADVATAQTIYGASIEVAGDYFLPGSPVNDYIMKWDNSLNKLVWETDAGGVTATERVPYTGATGNVNLGTYDASADSVTGQVLYANSTLDIVSGGGIIVGSIKWRTTGDYIDGEQIADDTIDDDSIDLADITLADFTNDASYLLSALDKVPYTGATGNITLGTYNVSADVVTGQVVYGASVEVAGDYFLPGSPVNDYIMKYDSGTSRVRWEADAGAAAEVDTLDVVCGRGATTDVGIKSSATIEVATITVLTGSGIQVGTIKWSGASDKIDGEQIYDDTIDDDSIDLVDITLADFTNDSGYLLSALDKVPYSGATGNITLGTYNVSADVATAQTIYGASIEVAGDYFLPGSPADNYILKWDSSTNLLNWETDAGVGNSGYATAFTNSSLVAGTLTVTHSLNSENIITHIRDNDGLTIIPDSIDETSTNAVVVDLTSFGTLTGTWRSVFLSDGGAITPPGADTQVVYNDSGSYGAEAGMTYNETTDSLTLVGELSSATVNISTGNDLMVGTTRWNDVATDGIDGEQIAADTIDDDSIDWADVTIADWTGTQTAGAVAFDYGGATSFKLPQASSPTVNAAGEIALDIIVSEHKPMWKYYTGATEMVVIAIPSGDFGVTDNYILKYDRAQGNFKLEADAGGAGEVSVMLRPQSAKLPTLYYPVIDAGDNNWRLLYDEATRELATWEFILDDDWGAGTLYADVYFSMTSGATGSVVWNGEIMAVTPGDAADIGTDSYGTANYATQTVQDSAGEATKCTLTLSNADSAAAGDYIRFRLTREAVWSGDTSVGDAECVHIVIRE